MTRLTITYEFICKLYEKIDEEEVVKLLEELGKLALDLGIDFQYVCGDETMVIDTEKQLEAWNDEIYNINST